MSETAIQALLDKQAITALVYRERNVGSTIPE